MMCGVVCVMCDVRVPGGEVDRVIEQGVHAAGHDVRPWELLQDLVRGVVRR